MFNLKFDFLKMDMETKLSEMEDKILRKVNQKFQHMYRQIFQTKARFS